MILARLKCANIEARLWALAVGELEEAESLRVRRHLESCSDCRETFNKVGETVRLMGGGRERPVEPSRLGWQDLCGRMEQSQSVRARRPVGVWTTSLGFATVLAVLFVIIRSNRSPCCEVSKLDTLMPQKSLPYLQSSDKSSDRSSLPQRSNYLHQSFGSKQIIARGGEKDRRRFAPKQRDSKRVIVYHHDHGRKSRHRLRHETLFPSVAKSTLSIPGAKQDTEVLAQNDLNRTSLTFNLDGDLPNLPQIARGYVISTGPMQGDDVHRQLTMDTIISLDDPAMSMATASNEKEMNVW